MLTTGEGRGGPCKPQTLKPKSGLQVQNAVHCTDLPEDGQLEVEYFFRIMQ